LTVADPVKRSFRFRQSNHGPDRVTPFGVSVSATTGGRPTTFNCGAFFPRIVGGPSSSSTYPCRDNWPN
jgi:hypothetical protein